MGFKLFVGNIAWATDEHTLREAFSMFGEIKEVKIIYDKQTGQSKGYGFVTFLDRDAAQNAFEAMNGKALDGKNLRIDYAQSRGGIRR